MMFLEYTTYKLGGREGGRRIQTEEYEQKPVLLVFQRVPILNSSSRFRG